MEPSIQYAQAKDEVSIAHSAGGEGTLPDIDCADIQYRHLPVVVADWHRFDSDRDGVEVER